MARTYYRHNNGDDWYWGQQVSEETTVETPWGEAIAEPGTYVMTLKGAPGHQIICTQEDLDNAWTVDSVPAPPHPEPGHMQEAQPVPDPPDLPGRNR